MKFGIRFIEYLGNIHDIVRYSVIAEEAGFEYVWYPHDIFMKNTWVITAAVATKTSQIKIGNIGTNPYTTDPAEIASYLATLDELSNGRTVIGVGLHTLDMVKWAGVDCSNILSRTRQSVSLIRRLLRGEVTASETEEFRWTDQCYLRFKPIRPEIPIYICAFGEDYLALSGEIGDGSLPMITPPASAPKMVQSIRKGFRNNGEGFDIAGCAWLSIAEDSNEAAAKMKSMISYFGPYLEEHALNTIGLSQSDFDKIRILINEGKYKEAEQAVVPEMLKLGIVGTPHQVIEQIEQLGSDGITHMNLGGPIGPDIRASIELLGKKVLPYFNKEL